MRRLPSVLRTLMTVALAGSTVAVLPACQSAQDRARDDMLSQASTFRDQLNLMPAEIDNTMQRLLAATGGQNPNRANDFREFTKSLTTLQDRARIVGREANRAEVAGEEYFTQWARSARNAQSTDRPAVRADAATSRQNYNMALEQLQAARNEFTELNTALTSVQQRLATNLSEQSILDAQPMVNEAISRATNVRNRIDRLDDAIDAALARR